MTSPVRDIRADYIAAYLAEYNTHKAAGSHDHADAVAEVLAQLGHEVRPKKPAIGDKERAIPDEQLETAVEAPKRRGRPSKTAE